MITTRATTALGITQPVALGGMSSGFTDARLVAAVSEAGGLGILGVSHLAPDEIAGAAAEIRTRTDRPFGLNLLLFECAESVDAVLATRPAVFSTAWPSPSRISARSSAAHTGSGRSSYTWCRPSPTRSPRPRRGRT